MNASVKFSSRTTLVELCIKQQQMLIPDHYEVLCCFIESTPIFWILCKELIMDCSLKCSVREKSSQSQIGVICTLQKHCDIWTQLENVSHVILLSEHVMQAKCKWDKSQDYTINFFTICNLRRNWNKNSIKMWQQSVLWTIFFKYSKSMRNITMIGRWCYLTQVDSIKLL